MSFDLNWGLIEKTVEKKGTVYPHETHSQYFTKVAVDRYRTSTGSSQLWELRDADDGKQYFFALYAEPEDVSMTTESGWSAIPDSAGTSVTLAFKSTPIHRFDTSELGVSKSDIVAFASYISNSAVNKQWMESLLNTMGPVRKNAVLKIIGEV